MDVYACGIHAWLELVYLDPQRLRVVIVLSQ